VQTIYEHSNWLLYYCWVEHESTETIGKHPNYIYLHANEWIEKDRAGSW